MNRKKPSRTTSKNRWVLTAILVIASCGDDFRPVVDAVEPLNGSTAVQLDTKPSLQLAVGSSAKLVVGDGGFLLRDITENKIVGGSIVIEGRKLTYQPKASLAGDHRYELILKKSAVVGEQLLDTDGSEWPVQPFVWPFRLRFSTQAAPQVRAVYLDAPRTKPRLFVRFSQPMDPVATADQFSLIDDLKKEVAMAAPVWVDDRSARLDILGKLDPAGLYSLTIGKLARGIDGTLFDGDRDGKSGEADDSQIVEFAGSEQVICSRFETEC